VILAIDPGSQKMGVAILDITGNLIEKKIIHNSFFEEYLKNILEKMDIHTIVSGDGTHHKDIIQRIESIIKKYTINEKNLKYNPMGGLIVELIINDDPELTITTTLMEESDGKLEHTGYVISGELAKKLRGE